MTSPVVSCVIIFYNAEPFLDEAIESVFAQHFEDWELILVDDGSVDSSAAIAQRWVDRAPLQARLVTHPGGGNRGMSASRNLGMASARGEYVAFLDADDVWLPHKLSEQVSIIEAHPDVAMVCGATVQWFSWDETREPGSADCLIQPGEPWLRGADNPRFNNVVVDPPALAVAVYPLGTGTSPSTSSFLFRRDAAAAVGGYEEQFRGLGEDLIFQTKFFLRYPVFVSTAIWDRYRQHPASSVAQGVERGALRDTHRAVLQWVEGYLDAHHIADPDVRAAHAAAMRPFRYPVRHRLGELASSVAALPARVLRKLQRELAPARPALPAAAPNQRSLQEAAGVRAPVTLGGPPRQREPSGATEP